VIDIDLKTIRGAPIMIWCCERNGENDAIGHTRRFADSKITSLGRRVRRIIAQLDAKNRRRKCRKRRKETRKVEFQLAFTLNCAVTEPKVIEKVVEDTLALMDVGNGFWNQCKKLRELILGDRGCPLSPTLFNICWESFLWRIEKEDMKRPGYRVKLQECTEIKLNAAVNAGDLIL
jgi:hypothetical protein